MNASGRTRLRLLLRDGAAIAAFASVALSGALPWPIIGLFVLAAALALGDRRAFGRSPGLSAVVLLLAAVGLFGLAFRGALDLVVAAACFATLVTAQRMLAAPTRQADHQVLLASLLLLAGGAALSGELWYAGCLFAYTALACLALGLAVIEGPTVHDGPLPVGPVFRQVGVGVVFALAGGAAFFVLFPRLSWNVASRRTPPGVFGGATGMSDRVRLGGGGSIKTSARVVFTAALSPDPGQEVLSAYWVGRRFDAFDGHEWRGVGEAAAPTADAWLDRPGLPKDRLEQRIELLPGYDSRTLVALDRPVRFASATLSSTSGATPVGVVEVAGEEVHLAVPGNAASYLALSLPSRPDVRLDDRARHLQLPPDLDPRVAALALQVVGAERDPRARARRLESWLREGFAYTLELPGEQDDPLTDFLFVRKAGHCEHFASSLAILLRTLDIPARVVGGFYGGQRAGARYLVRAGDAHAWTEAYIEGSGWLLLDATPSAGRAGQPSPIWGRLTEAWERLQEVWRRQVVDYSIQDQVGFVRALVRPPRNEERSALDPPVRTRPWRDYALAAGVGLVAFVVVRRALRPRARPPHPAASFREALEQRMARAGLARLDGESLEEASQRLRRARHPLAPALERAVRRYLEARFGERPLNRDERQALLAPLLPPPGKPG